MKFAGSLIRSGNNAKTVKSDKASGFVTAIMYLAPSTIAGGKTVCPFAKTAQCEAACLYTAGQGVYSNVQQARINKTRRFLNDRETFMRDLVADISKFSAACERANRKPAVRLNGTSDIAFERIPVDGCANIFDRFPHVRFYDYTKVTARAFANLPSNYSLTLSFSGANLKYAHAVEHAAKETGINVAVVYRSHDTVKMLAEITRRNRSNSLWERRVIDGDETDLRFLDPQGVIVGLYAKGAAKKDTTGFVLGEHYG